MSLSSLSDSVFISSIVAKHRPFKGHFNHGNRKKSQGAEPGEYGGWDMIIVLFLSKNLQTSNDDWALLTEQVRYRDTKAMNINRMTLR